MDKTARLSEVCRVHLFIPLRSRGIILLLVLYAVSATASPSFEFTSDNAGNIFWGGNAHLEIFLAPQKIVNEGVLTVKDEQGRLVTQRNVSLDQSGQSIEIAGNGFYEVELKRVLQQEGLEKLSMRNGHQESLAKTTVAVLPEHSGKNSKFFGLWQVHGNPELGVKVGVGWTKQLRRLKNYSLDEKGEIFPLTVPPVSPVIAKNYSRIDTFAFGLPLYLRDPRGDDEGEALYPPTNWKKFEKLVERFANDYEDIPEYFSVYNEPEVHWKGTTEELARFLTVIARSIKRVRPNVKVLGPGFATVDVDRMASLEKRGAFEFLDGIATNAYTQGSPPEGEFIQRIKLLKLFMNDIGFRGKPIFLTEFGWTTSIGTWQKPVTELTQAQYVSRSMALLSAEGVNTAIYFCQLFKEKNAGLAGFSVLNPDGTPKPSFVAYATALRMLDGKKLTHAELLKGVHYVQSNTKMGLELMIWNAGNRRVFLPLAFTKKALDMMGRDVDRAVNYELDGSPIYLDIVTKKMIERRLAKNIVKRGEMLQLPFLGEAYAANPLRISRDGKLHTEGAPLGIYVILFQKHEAIEMAYVEVLE